MIRTFILAGIAIITLSQCDSGPNAGSPKQQTVVVQKKSDTNNATDSSTTEGASSMSSEQVNKAKSLISSASASAIKGVNAKKIFKASCAICHGFKGNLGINGAKDLTASTISLKEAVAQVYFGKGLMTPFKDVLSDEEIVAVSKYAESLRVK